MVITLNCPEYQLGDALDLKKVSRVIDSTLTKHFSGKKVVLRALGSSKHAAEKPELIQAIEHSGSDRHDPANKGDRYNNAEGKHIDLFGRTCIIASGRKLSLPILEGFHKWAPLRQEYREHKVDIWLVYDRTKLKSVDHYYPRYNVRKRDGYAFRFPDKKKESLLGIISIK